MSFPKIDGYVVTEKLGSGSYSTVYKAYTKVGARTTVAIKCVDKSRVKHSGSAVDNLITEIRLLKTLSHPHIVQMHNFTWDDRNIYIIMEYCCGGDLSKYIHRYGRVPEKQVLYFLQQLASALRFLREKGVAHMDLKPHNLLLHKGSDGKYMLKVADFGFAQHLSEDSVRSLRGSPLYMAPEMWAGRYTATVDLWSVGVIMYECLFGKAPYSSNTFQELVEKIERRVPIEIPRGCSVSAPCLDLLSRLLQHDPQRRISYEDFFSHQYLDLEHMPSKENYEKAVGLIKRAIELDSCGELGPAFEAYRDGLLYLVPCVGCEGDAVRRGALTAKLTRYMERAEEIQQRLLAPPAPQQPRAAAAQARPRAGVVCCASALHASTTSYEFPNSRSSANKSVEMSGEAADTDTPRNGDVGDLETPGGDSIAQESTSASPRFRLFKYFSKQANVPFLYAKDSSITGEANSSEKSGKSNSTETANDTCRIT